MFFQESCKGSKSIRCSSHAFRKVVYTFLLPEGSCEILNLTNNRSCSISECFSYFRCIRFDYIPVRRDYFDGFRYPYRQLFKSRIYLPCHAIDCIDNFRFRKCVIQLHHPAYSRCFHVSHSTFKCSYGCSCFFCHVGHTNVIDSLSEHVCGNCTLFHCSFEVVP